jgi:hypothetical protein
MSGMGDGMGGGGPTARTLLLLAFAALALYYAVRAARESVLVHGPHLLMALGMLYMLIPGAWQVLPLAAWLGIFGAASAGCAVRTADGWRRDHHLDLEFAHSELAGCVAMMVMLPLFTVASIFAALPLTIALGTYFLAYAVFWAWRMRERLHEPPEASGTLRVRAQALAQMTMGAGMAYMFLVM